MGKHNKLCPDCGEHHGEIVRVFAVRQPAVAEFLADETTDPYQQEAMTVIREKLAALKAGEKLYCAYDREAVTRKHPPEAFIIVVVVDPDSNSVGVATAILCTDCADEMTPDRIVRLSTNMTEQVVSGFAQPQQQRLH